MSHQEDSAPERQHAWRMLGAVEDNAQIHRWLQALDENVSEPAVTIHPARLRTSWSRQRLLWTSGAIAGLVAATFITLQLLFAPLRYETEVGEQRDVLLPDGSRITMNTATALSVHYSDERREIALTHGEAIFTVTRDRTRPFEVTAAGVVTRALGTEFNVDLRSDRAVVSVLEGVVRVAAVKKIRGEITSTTRDPDSSIYVNALSEGQAVEFSQAGAVFDQQKADLKRIAAWRTRRVEFSDTPFAEAIEEFNRYSVTQLRIGSSELRHLRVSGVFRIGDIDGFLFSLKESLRIQAHSADGEIVLVRDEPETKPRTGNITASHNTTL